ncbi:MAG: hypothetical protein ACTSWN_14220 [Promethearchaeota archaeon]
MSNTTNKKDKTRINETGNKKTDHGRNHIPDLEEEFPEFKGWESIGFHRGLGREFYQIVIELFTAALYIFLLSYIVPILRPFPQIDGYKRVADGLFLVVYRIFDMGTNFGLNRFIAEYRVKNPKRMVQYISFTFWYQSFTGLVQISLLSYYVFQIFINSDFAYLTWIILLQLQKQYPGCLGIFKGTLEGMQHFNKVEVINLVQNVIFEQLSVLLLVIAFRFYGEGHVSYGIIMMIIYGHVIGSYIDDVVFSFVSIYFLDKILRKYFKLSARDLFRIGWDKEVMRDVIFYGLQGSAFPILAGFVETWVLLMWVAEINSYTTWVAIIGTGMGLAGPIGQFGDFALQTSIAESYSNGKKKLAEFYLAYSMRWRLFFMTMLTMVLLAAMPFFTIAITEIEAFEYYQGAETFLIPGIIYKLFRIYVDIPTSVMIGAKKISQHNILRVIEEIGKVFFTWLLVSVFRIHEAWGIVGLTLVVGYRHVIPYFGIKALGGMLYVHKKLFPVRFYPIITILIPLVASLPSIAFAQAFYHFAFRPVEHTIGIIPALAIAIISLVIIILFTFIPLNALLGGFDDYQLHTFKKAIAISGPSKPIFKQIYKLVILGVRFAKKASLHGRFSIPWKEAHEEMRQLMVMKQKNLNIS